ncbi:hypothetical protein C1I95_00540 [Micromonospora craterilacus]|uniref:DUF302 domain-containing protein n=1 Tax=Micromonospora craterilacus TaxID=1655439 RepID=A0A2W2F7R6_9ACTN|nr:DUF302 domain-containing protein [Micromonospora craterilacus]PZG24225.1 hypothetical protein C1I95_00540 [Micromonospora craterilacus]
MAQPDEGDVSGRHGDPIPATVPDGAETHTRVIVDRITLTSARAFDDVLADVYTGISRPDLAAEMHEWASAPSYADYTRKVREASGPAGLMRFLHLDLDTALREDPDITPYRLVRIIAGNPVTMSRMTRHVPDAGAYAPVTILLWQDGDTVRIAYDTVASLITPYGDPRALAVARELDAEVLDLLRRAAAAPARA